MATLWLDVLDETIRACAAHRRTDLVQRLQQQRTRLLEPTLRVLVVGEPKQGKSQLINALINAPACAVGDDITTTVPTVVRHAEQPGATVVTSPVRVAERAITSASAASSRVAVPVEGAAARTHPPRPGEFVHVEIGVPRALLRSGLVLIDTPPIGAIAAGLAEFTEAVLLQADTVLMVSDARHALSGAELEFLTRAFRSCPNVILALTKIDISPQWRTVAERSRVRLAEAGLPARVIPVSAQLRLHAARGNDTALNAESGFPELVGVLQRTVLTKADQLAPQTAAIIADTTIKLLVAPLQEERQAQTNGSEKGTVSQLREVQRRFDELRRHSARWQAALADDIADLTSDIEYDLRDRTRKILRRVDEFFESADPSVVWDSFTPWLEENLRNAAEANFSWLVERSQWMATRIAASFAPYQHQPLAQPAFRVAEDTFGSVAELERPMLGQFTLSQKLFTGLRGSYGGVVMFGLLTGLAGMPLINVFSIGAGAVFGGKTLHDEGEARRQRRQAVARAAVQRHVEDFFLKVSKDCRDVARQVHRTLRDHFAAVSDELQENLVDSARIAKQAVETDTARRESRNRQIQRELDGLVALHGKARLLFPVGEAKQVSG